MPPDETPQIRVESSNSVTAERATRKSSSDDLDKNDKSTLSAKDGGKRSNMHHGVLLGSISVFISILGAAVTFPFLQSQRDKLACDALCYGSMMSMRSGMSLIGTAIVGRASDRFGRKSALYVGVCASLLTVALNYRVASISDMWYAMIPSSLMNQNNTVLKALFADYNTERGGSEADRASSMGKLGMAVGVSFMLGPMLGSYLLKDYHEACLVSFVLIGISAIFLVFLPIPSLRKIDSEANLTGLVGDGAQSMTAWFRGLFKFIYLPAAQTPGARVLFVIRLCMGLAFHIFMTIWTVSLKSRFDFGPRDHAMFLGWIGLCYSVSQGFIAQRVIKAAGRHYTVLLLLCVVGLSVGRVMAMTVTSLETVYVIMAGVIIALGVMNTAMSSAVTRLADADQVGGLMGIVEAVENSAGLFGPTIGGILATHGTYYSLAVVVCLYSIVGIAVAFYFESHILNFRSKTRSVSRDIVDNDEGLSTERKKTQ